MHVTPWCQHWRLKPNRMGSSTGLKGKAWNQTQTTPDWIPGVVDPLVWDIIDFKYILYIYMYRFQIYIYIYIDNLYIYIFTYTYLYSMYISVCKTQWNSQVLAVQTRRPGELAKMQAKQPSCFLFWISRVVWRPKCDQQNVKRNTLCCGMGMVGEHLL